MVNKATVCDEKILELSRLTINQTDRKNHTELDLTQETLLKSAKTQKNQTLSDIGLKLKKPSKELSICSSVESTYIAFMKKRFWPWDIKNPHKRKNKELKKTTLNIVVDCGHGASGPLAQKVFKALEKYPVRVHWLYAQPDGRFPHHHPDPSLAENLKDLQNTVQKTHSHFGVAWDGDGDRLVVVGPNGRILQGDELMSIFISDILASKAPLNQEKKIVVDVKCADWFFKFLSKKPVQTIMWKSGHSLIRQKTIAEKAVFGGELSGHFFFCHEDYPIDDGLYGLLRLIEITLKTDKGTEELIALKNTIDTPEIRHPVTDETIAKQKIKTLKNFYMQKKLAHCVFIDGVRVSFPGQAWGLARFSNTQKEWTLRFGGQNPEALQKIQADFYRILDIQKTICYI